MGLISKLRAMPKKWLITVVALFSTIVVSVGVLVPVLVLGKKGKVVVSDYAKLEVNSSAVVEYYMGDEIDLRGISVVGLKKGAEFSVAVTKEMVVLPESGVDEKSGLNKKGVFLGSGGKTITISYEGQALTYEVTVEADAIVSLSFKPSAVASVEENARADEALRQIEVRALCQSGRQITLSAEDVTIVDVFDPDNRDDGSALKDGKIQKKNTTVYSQPITLQIRYSHVFGENLPIVGEEVIGEFSNATVTERNVYSLNVNFDTTKKIYRSVATSTDFAYVMDESPKSVYKNGDEADIYFTDGKYLYKIVEFDGIKGYSFVIEGGEPMEYNASTARYSYAIYYYFSLDANAERSRFLPFGAEYEIGSSEPIPTTASQIGNIGGLPVFLPTVGSVFLGEDSEEIYLQAELTYETRLGEIWVKNTGYGVDYAGTGENSGSISVFEETEGAYEAASESQPQMRPAINFYVVVDKDGEKHYVTDASFKAYFAGAGEAIYYNNYGFSEQEEVYEKSGYYYRDASDASTLIDVANITKVTGYKINGKVAGYILKQPYGYNLLFGGDSVESITFEGGESHEFSVRSIERDDFVLKVTKKGTILAETNKNGFCYEIDKNYAVGIEQDGDYVAEKRVGDIVTLGGYAFKVTLANGDVVELGSDGKYRYFGEEKSWTNADFVAFGREVAENELIDGNRADYLGKRAVYTSAGEAVECSCVYIGELADSESFDIVTKVDVKVESDGIESAAFGSKSYVVSSGENFAEDLKNALIDNLTSISFASGRTTSRRVVTVVFSEAEAESVQRDYATPRIEGESFAIGLIAVLPAEIVDGEEFSVDFYLWDEAGVSAYNVSGFKVVRTTKSVYYGGIALGGKQIEGEKFGFASESANLVGEDTLVIYNSQGNVYKDGVTVSDLTTKSLNDAGLLGANYGKYTVKGQGENGAYVYVTISYRENGVAAGTNSFRVVLDGYSLNPETDTKPNVLYANGNAIEAGELSAYKLYVNLLSREDVELGKVSEFGDYITINTAAPNVATNSRDIEFVFNNSGEEYVFTARLKFFANATTGFSKLLDFEKGFVSETGLELVVGENEYGMYRRTNAGGEFDAFAEQLEAESLVNNYVNDLYASAGVKFEMTEYGLRNVSVEHDGNGYYCLVGDTKYYVEEDFVFSVQGEVYSRIVFNLSGTSYALYVKQNPAFNASQPEGADNLKYIGGALAGGTNFVAIRWEDSATNSGVINDDREALKSKLIELSMNSGVSYVTLGAVGNIYGADGDANFIKEVKSNKIKVVFYEIPQVKSGEVEEGSVLVEGQALSLGELTDAGRALLSESGNNYAENAVAKFPGIKIYYKTASQGENDAPNAFAANRYLLKNLKFLQSEASGEGEIGYSISADGKAIIIGGIGSGNSGEVEIWLSYLGMKFSVTVNVTKDFIVSASYGRKSLVEGSDITEISLSTDAKDIVWASGKTTAELVTDEEGKIEGIYETLVAVKKGYSKWLVKPEELYLVLGAEYEGVDGATRLFSYSDNYTYTTYSLLIEPVGVAYTVDSALYAAVFGNWAGTGYGKGKAAGSARLELSADRLEDVSLSGIKTVYRTTIESLGVYDYFSLSEAHFEFTSGLEFTCPAGNVNYLVARNGEIVVSSTVGAADTVLRKFELTYGVVSRSTGNIAVMDSVVGGKTVDVSMLAYAQPLNSTLLLTFNAGGFSYDKEVEISYVEPEVTGIELTYAEGEYEFAYGQKLSKADIIGYSTSGTILCSNMDNISLSKAQRSNLYIQHSDKYKVQDNGTSIYIESDNFALSDVVFGLEKAADEVSLDQILEESYEFEDVSGGKGIKRYKGAEGNDVEIEIPSEYKGRAVVGISAQAFGGKNLGKVVIAGNVKTIGNSAFKASGVRSIEIGASVITIGADAFDKCSNLSEVNFASDGVISEIGAGAFSSCNSLKYLEIPSSVTSVGSSAFYSAALENLVVYSTNADVVKGICDVVKEFGSGLSVWVSADVYAAVNEYVISKQGAEAGKYLFQLKTIGSDEYLALTFRFRLADDEQSYIIEQYIGKSQRVIIPAMYDGLEVSGIGAFAFTEVSYEEGHEGDNRYILGYNGKNIRSVDATSAKLVWIGVGAFAGCVNLTSVKLGSGLESIGALAFSESGIMSITIPASVESVVSSYVDGDDGDMPAFFRCANLAEIVVEDGNTVYESRGANAIIERETNKMVVGCKSTEIPDGVVEIGDYAFYGCTGLVRIEIPASVTKIGETHREETDDGYKLTGGLVFAECANLAEVIFANGISLESIEFGTFLGCSSLERIVIPEGVEGIEEQAFGGCFSLTAVRLPSTLEKVYEDAFYGCSRLSSIYYGGSVKGLFGVEFNNDRGKNYHFFNGRRLYVNEVEVRDITASRLSGLTAISDMLYGCKSVRSVEIPTSVRSISDNAFYGCVNLESVVIAGSVTTVGQYAFKGCTKLASVEIGEGVSEIKSQAFENCTKLSGITIPASATIKNGVFNGCSSLSEITLKAEDITTLKAQCKAISYSNMWNAANKKGTVKVDVEQDVFVEIYNYCVEEDYSAKFEVVNLRKVNTQTNGFTFEWYSDLNGYVVTGYEGEGGEVVIPGTLYAIAPNGVFAENHPVVGIAESAFMGNTTFTSVDMSGCAGLTTIGDWAFSGCESLETVNLSGCTSLKTIERQAFAGCESLASITIPASVTKIDNCAFFCCESLVSVDLSCCTSLTTIETEAFYCCESLTEIDLSGCTSLENIGDNAFHSCKNLGRINMSGCVELVAIRNSAFDNCISLVSVNFPHNSKLDYIDREAFKGCSSLVNITIPASVKYIGPYAFSSCKKLSNLQFATSEEGNLIIGEFAFIGSAIKEIELPEKLLSSWFIESFYASVLNKVIYRYNRYIPSGEYYVDMHVTTSHIDDDKIKFTIDGGYFHISIAWKLLQIGFEGTFYVQAELVDAVKEYIKQYDEDTDTYYYPFKVLPVDGAAQDEVTAGQFKLKLNSAGTGWIIEDAVADENGVCTVPELHENKPLLVVASGAVTDDTMVTFDASASKITTIEDWAFETDSLQYIILPSTVTSIGANAFTNCKNLVKITILGAETENEEEAQAELDRTKNLIDDLIDSDYNVEVEVDPSVAGEIWSYVNYEQDPSDPAQIDEDIVENQKLLITPNDNRNNLNQTDYEMTYLSNGSYKISGYNGSATNLYLPSIYNNKPVVEIGAMAFSGKNIVNIVIPSSISYIEDGAFFGCANLKYISFANNSQLKQLGVVVNSDCTSLKSVKFGSNSALTLIGYGAFKDSYIETIDFGPNSQLKKIGGLAFQNSKLISINLPNSLTDIGSSFNESSVFLGCKNLTTITIPQNVVYIADDCFMGCTKLSSVVFESNSQLTKLSQCVFSGCEALETVDFGTDSALSTIEMSAFMNCSKLFSVYLPNNLKTIGDSAFYDCSKLRNLYIPDGVTEIGREAFAGCSSLVTFKIPSSVTDIAQSLFKDCVGLSSVVISGDVTSVGDRAFNGCTNLTSIEFETTEIERAKLLCEEIDASSAGYGAAVYYGVVYVDSSICGELSEYVEEQEYSFTVDTFAAKDDFEFIIDEGNDSYILNRYNGKQRYVEIPSTYLGKNVIKIGFGAFRKCETIDTVVVPYGIQMIGDYAFDSCSNLKHIAMSDSVTYIGSGAFCYCEKLDSVVIPSSVTNVGNNLFSNCYSVTSVQILGNIKTIKSGMFNKCYALNEIIIPNSVTQIGYSAFYNCTTLSGINIPTNVATIGDYAFANCENLGSVHFESNSKLWSIGSNAFFECNNLTSINLPQGVTTIGSAAFKNCGGLLGVLLPLKLPIISAELFYGCSNLASITIPSYVTYINEFAFAYCNSLESVEFEFNSELTKIGNNAFCRCSLNYISIPTKVHTIGDKAFYDCFRLRSINIPATVTEIGEEAFSGDIRALDIIYLYTTDLARAKVLCDFLSHSNYARQVYVDSSIQSALSVYVTGNEYLFAIVGESQAEFTFSLSSDESYYILTNYRGDGRNIVIPEKYNNLYVKAIGDYVFDYIGNINILQIHSSITTIGRYAFRSSNIEKVYYGGSLAEWCAINFETPSSNPIGRGYCILYDNNGRITALTKDNLSGIVKINNYAFSGYKWLVNLTIPSDIEVGDYAFQSCKNLKSITIESGAKLGIGAFSNCGVVDLSIKAGVTDIGAAAFASCDNLKNVSIQPGMSVFSRGLFAECNNLTNITIPEGVTELLGHVFYNCKNLKSVTLPSSLKKVGAKEFYYCTSLKSVYFNGSIAEWCGIFWGDDDSTNSNPIWYANDLYIKGTKLTAISVDDLVDVTYIYSAAFIGYDKLQSVSIPSNVLYIGGQAFANCSSLSSVNIADGVIGIGSMAFAGCSSLQGITLPDSVDYINDLVFYECSRLSSVTLPRSLKYMGESVFSYCTSLTNVVLPDSIQDWSENGRNMFEYCTKLTSVSLPSNITTIGVGMFGGCSALYDFSIPNYINKIGYGAFGDCTNLANIQIPNSVTTVGARAFINCTNLASITLPSGLLSIGEYAFESTQITSIQIPSTVTYIGKNPFLGCSLLSEIVVDEQNESYYDVDNKFLISRGEERTLITGLRFSSIPGGILVIGEGAFFGVVGYGRVVIPSSVTRIEERAFENCAISSVVIPENVEDILNYAFHNCAYLVSVYLKTANAERALDILRLGNSWPYNFAGTFYLNNELIMYYPFYYWHNQDNAPYKIEFFEVN